MVRISLAVFLAWTIVGCNESRSLNLEAGTMEFGRISRGEQPIQLDEWCEMIESKDFLQPIPDRKGTNPFTKEEVVFSGEGKAYYVENGEEVGNIALEDGELLTTGVPKAIRNLIAEQLGAQVFRDDRS